MNIVCLDLEGTLAPEIWVEIAKAAGIPELTRTTRDEPDYDVLMRFRIDALNRHGVGMEQVLPVLETIEPLPGARAFLDELRPLANVCVVSDTFTQFAGPLMEKLGWPMLFCNELVVDLDGTVRDYRMRSDHMKLSTVRGLQALGYDTMAAGDGVNDLEMIRASKAGWLFNAAPATVADNPDVGHLTTYDGLLTAIKENL